MGKIFLLWNEAHGIYLTGGSYWKNPGLDGLNSDASNLYGWYTMLVYITPIIGGLIDKYLGSRKTILIGDINDSWSFVFI